MHISGKRDKILLELKKRNDQIGHNGLNRLLNEKEERQAERERQKSERHRESWAPVRAKYETGRQGIEEMNSIESRPVYLRESVYMYGCMCVNVRESVYMFC